MKAAEEEEVNDLSSSPGVPIHMKHHKEHVSRGSAGLYAIQYSTSVFFEDCR